MDGVSFLIFIYEFIVNLFEKVKNLLIWKNPKATWSMFLFLILVLVLVTFLPLRYLIIIVIFRKFNKGKRYWDWVRKNNWEVAIIELKNYFRTKNINNPDFSFWPKIKNIDKEI